MKFYHHILPSLFLFYALYHYTTFIAAVLVVIGFLLPLLSPLLSKYENQRNKEGVYFAYTIYPVAVLMLISLFYLHLGYLTVGWFFQIVLAIFEKGVKLFHPFSQLNLHLPAENLERRVLIWSIIGIILIYLQ